MQFVTVIGEENIDMMEVSEDLFMAFIGTLIDEYGHAHRMSAEHVQEMTQRLCEVQKDVHMFWGGVV